MVIINESYSRSFIAQTTQAVLTPEQCDDIIRLGQNQPLLPGSVAMGTPEDKKRFGIDKSKRTTRVSWIPFNLANQMYHIIERWMLDTNSNHMGFDGMQLTEPAQYTEYDKGGFYDWHTDSNTEMSSRPPIRKISMTLLLNDPKDFQGGEFEIVEDKKCAKLKRGYAVFFASFIRHRIKPILKGNRKSLVMWFGGTPLR